MFGDLDDYYMPILAKESFNGNYQFYTCRGDKDRDMPIDIYLSKVTPYLRILINEKKIRDQKIQLDIGINLRHIELLSTLKQQILYVYRPTTQMIS